MAEHLEELELKIQCLKEDITQCQMELEYWKGVQNGLSYDNAPIVAGTIHREFTRLQK
jgi:FtsZ-binding cell division protein ZapB